MGCSRARIHTNSMLGVFKNAIDWPPLFDQLGAACGREMV
jgi:hypothetical protein